MAASILISNSGSDYFVTVSGRATFECAPQFRALQQSLEKTEFTSVNMDLGECTGMDSTFMGIIAAIAIRAKALMLKIRVYRAGENNTKLLCGLGLKKYLDFMEGTMSSAGNEWGSGVKPESILDAARTILDAHKTLMKADESNVAKFGKVVELAEEDVKRLEKENTEMRDER